ncbi:MAG: hypothetical protein CMI60_16885 [Parvibaculum sp.]|nr:hypothetical protein [Parvibaculum sp.]
MCEPVSLGLGLLSAGASGLSAYAGHQQAQDQAAAQNRSIANQANQRNRKYELDNLRGIAEYNQDVMDVRREQDAQALAFAGFAAEEELAKDDRINKYLVEDQTLVAKLLGEKSSVKEGGRSRSYGKNAAKEIGRQRAMMVSNLTRSDIASKRNVDKARKSADAQRQKLFAQVATPFRAGPAPSQNIEFVKGPSKLGLAANLAGAAVGGASTYNSFAPEGQQLSDLV